MTDFDFNCMTAGNRLMRLATRQHHIDVEEANVRQTQREAARVYRKIRCEKRLSTVLLIATMISIAVTTWFLAVVAK